MKSAFIIHGAHGSPDENWFPWLKKELESEGYEVFVPAFPTPKKQELREWLRVLSKVEKSVNEDSIFIGHSVGVAFILSILEKISTPIKAAFLVSGFLGKLGNPDFDRINQSFTEKDFDVAAIKKKCKCVMLFHGSDDPYVPVGKAQQLQEVVGGELIIVPQGGHLNAASGYKKFPLLLEKIRQTQTAK